MNEVTEFSTVSISSASVQMITGDVQAEGKKFGCMGTLSATTEVRQITKNCEGDERIITIPRYMTVTIGAHIQRDVIDDIYGISTEGLKEGVYSYGIKSKGKKFVFTADVTDVFEDVVQLIAFPKCSNLGGLSITIDNDADAVAYVEMELRANADSLGNFHYRAFASEVDELIKTGWHTNFTPALIGLPEG